MQTPRRIAMGVRYDGSAYHGWQSQLGEIATVQSRVEKALGCVAAHTISVVCAGRTDAGVHATQQVVHFNTTAERSEKSWIFGANSHLPSDISVVWATEVDSDFHARFSAHSRRYRYLLYNYHVRPGILRNAVGWHHKQLDEKNMQKAADSLLGKHDFTSFRGAHCQANTPERTVYELAITRHKHLIIIDIEANAFLLHMVRNIVGSLLAVGSGYRDPRWISDVLEARDRTQAGVTASPAGLYLVDVGYDETYHLPKIPLGPFFLHGTLL
jgi:tRNA pseudouridine38-40 synthase